MPIQKAVYAASLDPITNGHINIVERMAPRFDELTVIVAVNPDKKYTFSASERVAMAQSAFAKLPNVRVIASHGRYVVKVAEELGATTVIRGIRNFKDLEDENGITMHNRAICPSIETIFIPCLPELAHVSSSAVKGHIGADPEWDIQVAKLVPSGVLAKIKDMHVLQKARKHWTVLMNLLGNPKRGDAIFEDICARYREPHRAYHTLTHIVSMLDELEEVKYLVENLPVVMMCVWLHDIVYVTDTRNIPHLLSNEVQSAEYARGVIDSFGLSDLLGDEIAQGIRATEHIAQSAVGDIALLLDLDLAILGKDERTFNEYEKGVRFEYSWASDFGFDKGRAEILKKFLARDRIYFTEQFFDNYEEKARTNLKHSIIRLEALKRHMESLGTVQG